MKIVLVHSDEGCSVSVPGLPGCWSQGDREAAAIDNIKIAVQEYLSVKDDLKEKDLAEGAEPRNRTRSVAMAKIQGGNRPATVLRQPSTGDRSRPGPEALVNTRNEDIP